MPIRTNRGRAAVYRRLWGWPMRSPAHLAGTLLVLAAVVVTVGIAMPRLFGTSDDGDAVSRASNEGSAEQRGKDPAYGAMSDGSTSMPTRLTEPLVTPSSAPPAPEALNVAEKWAQAWVHHPEGTTTDAWLEGMKPYTTKEFLPVMSSVDVKNIPSGKITGEPDVVSSFSKSVVAAVPTDGPDLLITVVDTDYGWRVAHYERAG